MSLPSGTHIATYLTVPPIVATTKQHKHYIKLSSGKYCARSSLTFSSSEPPSIAHVHSAYTYVETAKQNVAFQTIYVGGFLAARRMRPQNGSVT